MQELHEFSWNEDPTEGGRLLDLRLIEKEDGSFTIQNLQKMDQTCEARTPDEAVTQFTNLFERRVTA